MTRLVPLEKSGSPLAPFPVLRSSIPPFRSTTHNSATTRAIDRRQDQRRQRAPSNPATEYCI